MRKKLMVAAGVIIAIGAAYAVWDYMKLTAMGKEIDTLWPKSAELYNDRLATIIKLKDGVKDAVTGDKKTISDLENAVAALKSANGTEGQIGAVNDVEKSTAKLIIALDKYPETRNLPEVQADIEKLTGVSSMDWMKPYNDPAAKYNITIHRIRNRVVTSVFGIKDKATIGPAQAYIKDNAEKAAKKEKNKK